MADHLFSEFQTLVAPNKERKVVVFLFFLNEIFKSYEKKTCHLAVIFVASLKAVSVFPLQVGRFVGL